MTASLLAPGTLSPPGKRVPERRGEDFAPLGAATLARASLQVPPIPSSLTEGVDVAAVAGGGMADFGAQRHVAAVEMRLTAMVSELQREHVQSLQEADKLVCLSQKNTDIRMQKIEERQQGFQEQLQKVTEVLGQLREEGRQTHDRIPAVVAAPVETEPQAPRRFGMHGDVGGDAASNSDAMFALQALQEFVGEELRLLRHRCDVAQDLIDERALLPLAELARRVREQEQTVQQLVELGQENASRMEEHEFRLGVTRTKLDVHDQKLAVLDQASWERSATRSGNCGGRRSDDRPWHEQRSGEFGGFEPWGGS